MTKPPSGGIHFVNTRAQLPLLFRTFRQRRALASRGVIAIATVALLAFSRAFSLPIWVPIVGKKKRRIYGPARKKEHKPPPKKTYSPYHQKRSTANRHQITAKIWTPTDSTAKNGFLINRHWTTISTQNLQQNRLPKWTRMKIATPAIQFRSTLTVWDTQTLLHRLPEYC